MQPPSSPRHQGTPGNVRVVNAIPTPASTANVAAERPAATEKDTVGSPDASYAHSAWTATIPAVRCRGSHRRRAGGSLRWRGHRHRAPVPRAGRSSTARMESARGDECRTHEDNLSGRSGSTRSTTTLTSRPSCGSGQTGAASVRPNAAGCTIRGLSTSDTGRRAEHSQLRSGATYPTCPFLRSRSTVVTSLEGTSACHISDSACVVSHIEDLGRFSTAVSGAVQWLPCEARV